MKKFLFQIILMSICTVAIAETINLHWLNDNGTTYTESTCTVDDDLIIPTTPPTKYGYTFTGWETLPFTPIKYLESTGTQYIDTGVNVSDSVRVDISFAIPKSVQFNMFFGARKNYGYFALLFPGNNPNAIRFDYYNSEAMICSSENSLLGKTVLLEFNNNHKTSVYDINHNLLCEQNLPVNKFFMAENIFLFAVNNPYAGIGSIAFAPTLKIYYAQIYDNDALVHDFIPVLDEDGTPCMYDRVEKKFYYNAGTGQFVAGPVIGE